MAKVKFADQWVDQGLPATSASLHRRGVEVSLSG